MEEVDARSVHLSAPAGTLGAMDGGEVLQGRTRACPGRRRQVYWPTKVTVIPPYLDKTMLVIK